MQTSLALITADESGNSGQNVLKLAQFMGIDHVGRLHSLRHPAAGVKLDTRACAVIRANELTAMREEEINRLSNGHNLFLYGFSGGEEEARLLLKLTKCRIRANRNFLGRRRTYGVQYENNVLGLKIDNLQFILEEDSKNGFFEIGKCKDEIDILMTVDGNPFFVKINSSGSTIYIAGCDEIADIDLDVPKSTPRFTYFPAVVPLVIFMRETFGKSCWHNEAPMACFVVDDPLLKMEYGSIYYDDLLKVLLQQKMSASIAFIPWNYKRTKKEVADLFLAHPENYSLSLHGCDHIIDEYTGSDDDRLRGLALKGLDRMNAHQEYTGVPYGKIMVFPGGLFSTNGMKALKSAGYQASVNTTLYPADAEGYCVKLSELLDVAIMRYSNLPLFARRYPVSMAELAFDLFMGKPVLLVEHQTYFRRGYGELCRLGERMAAMQAGLKWSSLAEICTRTSLRKVDEDGSIHVKFYSDHFRLGNETDGPQNYHFYRYSEDQTDVMMINGNEVKTTRENDYMKSTLALKPGETADVRVESRRVDAESSIYRNGWVHNGRIRMRRLISEFRDNYVDTNENLGKLWLAIRDRLIRRKRDIPV